MTTEPIMPLYGSRRAKMKESDIEADDAKSFEEKPDRFDFLSNFYPFTAGDVSDLSIFILYF